MGESVKSQNNVNIAPETSFVDADKFIDRIFPKRRIEKVLFIVPPDADANLFNYASAKRGRYPNYPPYGFGLLASHLRRESIEVSLLNLNSLILRACKLSETADDFIFDDIWEKALEEKLAEYEADLICVACMFTQTHRSLSQVCSKIKKIAPSTPLAAGGVHITNSLTNEDSSKQLIDDLGVELLFLYEAEIAFRQFVRVVNRMDPVESLTQMVLNTDEAGLIRIPGRMTPEDGELDVIPAYDLMDPVELSKWGKVGSYAGLVPEKKRFATVLANRGCRAQCTFCSVRNFNGAGVRRRSVESVIDELLMLKEVYGVEHVMWLDDDLFYDRHETLRLFNEIIRQKIDITWDCTNGVIVSAITEEIIAAAAESGCIGLNLGMESGNDEILKEVKKPGTVRNFLDGAEILRRHPKIFTKVFIIIGFPGETYRQQMDTIEVTQEMGMDWHLMQILQPLPNTPIFKTMLEDGLLDPKDFEAVHNAAGAYGKISKDKEKKRDLLGSDFKNAFDVKDLDAVVPREEFDNIWAYMNFHQNYKPLLEEQRPEKLRQKALHLKHIYEVVAPDDAMAMFYAGFLQKRLHGRADEEILSNLAVTLNESPYWNDRFRDFDLSISQIQ
jgi:radical SAM superfamily enzyme YgiQ (UPF0313 family)